MQEGKGNEAKHTIFDSTSLCWFSHSLSNCQSTLIFPHSWRGLPARTRQLIDSPVHCILFLWSIYIPPFLTQSVRPRRVTKPRKKHKTCLMRKKNRLHFRALLMLRSSGNPRAPCHSRTEQKGPTSSEASSTPGIFVHFLLRWPEPFMLLAYIADFCVFLQCSMAHG